MVLVENICLIDIVKFVFIHYRNTLGYNNTVNCTDNFADLYPQRENYMEAHDVARYSASFNLSGIQYIPRYWFYIICTKGS